MHSKPNENGSKTVQPQPAVLLVGAAAVGIGIDRFFELSWGLLLAGAGVAAAVWLLTNIQRRKKLASMALLLAWACLFGLWHHCHWNWFPANDIQAFTQEDPVLVCLEARLLSEPRMVAAKADDLLNPVPSSERTRMLTQVIRIRDQQAWKTVTGQAELVVHGSAEHLRSGDLVTVYGRLVGADSTRNPGQYDFREFGRSKRRLAKIHVYRPEGVSVFPRSANWGLGQLKSNIRRRLNQLTWQHVASERAGLASAVLLGNREQLNSERRDLFLTTGTVHLLAISGLHIGILAGLFFLLYRVGLVSRNSALLCTIAFVVFYAWLVEFRPPVLRASILIVLFCFARLIGRGGLSFNLLAWAGLIVLALNPTDLFQIGPQLSFLAVATLIFCQPYIFPGPETDPLKRLIRNTRSTPVRMLRWVWEQAWITIKVSAFIWIVALPLVAFRFHLVVPAALVLNPLVMIPIAIALYAGLGVLVLGWFIPAAADLSGSLCNLSLGWIESLIVVGQEIPAGHFWTSGPPAAAVAVFYLFVLVFAIYPKSRVPGRWLVAFALVWVSFGWLIPSWWQASANAERQFLEVTFVDTGHGGSALIRLPKGETLLYDSGCLGSAEYGVSNISAVLWDSQVEHVDALIISHADVDHFNAAVALCQRFSIGIVYVSPMMLESSSGSVRFVLHEFERQGIKVRTLVGGQRFMPRSDAVELNALGPPPRGIEGNDNSNSIVLSIEAFGKRILLPGDLEDDGLDRLLRMDPRKYQLAMAPHHGSLNSRPASFAEWSAPSEVVVSASQQRMNRNAIEQFESMGSRVWMTGRDGAIRCRISQERFEISNWVHGRINDEGYFSNRGFRF